jgi:hypothetical protein
VSEPNASSALSAHFAFGLLEAGPRARALIAISPFWSISPQITALSMGRSPGFRNIEASSALLKQRFCCFRYFPFAEAQQRQAHGRSLLIWGA